LETHEKAEEKEVQPVKEEEKRETAQAEEPVVDFTVEKEEKEKKQEEGLSPVEPLTAKKEENLPFKIEKGSGGSSPKSGESHGSGRGQARKKEYEFPPFFDGIVEDTERIVGEFYARFKQKIKSYIGDKEFARVQSYRADKNVDLVEALIELKYMESGEVLQVQKEIVEEIQMPKVAFVYSNQCINVEFVEDRCRFYLNGVECVPSYYIPNCYKKDVVKDKFVAILPYDQYKILISKASILEQTKGKGETSITFEDILKDAILQGASDIHIVPKEGVFYTYFRINKQFVRQKQFSMSPDEWKVFAQILFTKVAEKTVGNFKVDEFRAVNEGRLDYPDLNCSVRFEYIPDGHSLQYGEIICRILKRTVISGNVPLEEQLGEYYDKKDVQTFKSLAKMEGGLAVISGKTNSGKSTFLAKLISTIPENKKVGTIEDPIEYIHSNPNVVQHQLYLPPNEEERLGYLEYVKAFKRADYDVVLVGEWRNFKGLTEAMVEQAQAGQLIFTTLHITSAFEIYEALKNIFNVPYEISAGLILFSFNQSLVPMLCPECSIETEISFAEEEVALIRSLTREEKEELANIRPFMGRKRGNNPKCHYCGGTGIAGMIPLYEFFIPDEEIKNRVIKDKSLFTPLMLKQYVIQNKFPEKGLARLKTEKMIEYMKAGLIEKDIMYVI
jgi:type II secretory ATPase GspE/PulE/Tfp pilus assembly ATPase PilB-like protein